MTTTKDHCINVLRATYDVLEDRHVWTKGREALTMDRVPIAPTSDQAVAWCLVGALKRCAAGDGLGYLAALLMLTQDAPRDADPEGWLKTWNDSAATTHGQVLLRLGNALLQAERRAW